CTGAVAPGRGAGAMVAGARGPGGRAPAAAVPASSSMDTRTLAVGDQRLVVAEAGAGGRPLLLLHGFTGAKEDFTEWLDPLAARGWHAVAPDHRGHGSSSHPDSEEAYSFTILADDNLALADALGWERFALLGHSMGGMVAQLMAAAAPERLTALVLMDTGHGPVDGLDPDLAAAAVHIVRTQGMEGLLEAMKAVESPLSTPAHLRVLAERPGYEEFGDTKMRATSPQLYAAMTALFLDSPDRLAALGTLPAGLPTLVIVGDQDRPFIKPSERMTGAIAGARLAVVPDAGHSPQFENPDGWWAALSGFLDALPA
ncbi:MAG: alpha/beta fold hydrolase, partial [Acidimicrobiales bacterium]